MTTAIETPPEIQAAADAVVEANDEKMKAMPFIERIWLMRQELGMLPKLGENRPQGYNYLQESDVTVAVRKLEKRFRVMFVLGQQVEKTHIDATLKSKSGNPMTGVSVVQRYDVINVDNPDESLSSVLGWDLSSEGYSADSGDKALYKARTGAKKYALTDTFLIASGDDPERVGLADDAQQPARAQAPRGAGDDLGRATEGQIKAFKNRSRGVRSADVIRVLGQTVGMDLKLPPGDVPEFIKTMSAKQMNLALAELNKLPRKPRAADNRGTRTITDGPEQAPPPPRTPSASAGRVPDDSSAEQR